MSVFRCRSPPESRAVTSPLPILPVVLTGACSTARRLATDTRVTT